MNLTLNFRVFVVAAFVAAPLAEQSASASTINYAYDRAGRLLLVDYGGKRTQSYAYDPSSNILLASAPVPALNFSMNSTGQLTVSWPILPGGFILQSTQGLGPGAVWPAVQTSPSQSNGLNFVTAPLGTGMVFYRLASP